MVLSEKSLIELRNLINEKTEYRKGFELVCLFNTLGFEDFYDSSFPSRWKYTDERLRIINGKPELDKCIRTIFNPQNFIGRFKDLQLLMKDFNQYLAFDGWKVLQRGKDITFTKADEIDFSCDDDELMQDVINENSFLEKQFEDISLEKLGLEDSLTKVLKLRLEEIKNCLSVEASLAVIFLSGSTLEGILLGFALKYPKDFNQSKSAPREKMSKSVKPFHQWTLANLINVACDTNLIDEDVKKYSHNLRDFRNYIHPYEQLSNKFNPNIETAKISFQVLKAAIYELQKYHR